MPQGDLNGQDSLPTLLPSRSEKSRSRAFRRAPGPLHSVVDYGGRNRMAESESLACPGGVSTVHANRSASGRGEPTPAEDSGVFCVCRNCTRGGRLMRARCAQWRQNLGANHHASGPGTALSNCGLHVGWFSSMRMQAANADRSWGPRDAWKGVR